MDRAEILRQELQMQQARIAQENREREKKLVEAYKKVGALNFLGFSPAQLQGPLPASFLRGSYSHCRLPSVQIPVQKPPVPASASANRLAVAPGPVPTVASQPSAPAATIASPAASKPSKKKWKQENFKPSWDSEWVAPRAPKVVKQRFGDDNWSSHMVINLNDTSDDEESESENDAPQVQEREQQLKSKISKLHIDHKAMENHIRQLSESLEKQRQQLEKKREQLSETLEEYKSANEELAKLATVPLKRRRVSTTRAPLDAPAKVRKVLSDPLEQHPHIDSPVPVGMTPNFHEPGVVFVGAILVDEPGEAGPVDAEQEQVKKEAPGPKEPAESASEPKEHVPERIEPAPEPTPEPVPEPKSKPVTAPVPVTAPAATFAPTAVAPSDTYKLNSPLALFNSYRISKLFIQGDASRGYSSTYNSPFVKDSELCPAELDGKKCQTKECPYTHFGEYSVPGQQILTHILKTYVDSATRKKFAKALRSVETPDSINSMELLLEMIQSE